MPAEASAPPQLETRLRTLGMWCGALAAAIGVVALLGWILGNDGLKGLYTGGIVVKTNTSVAIILGGLALLLLAPQPRSPVRMAVGRVLASVVIVIGLATLVEHLTGWNLRIDELLFREPIGDVATASPNRMGPPASICFPLLGLALALLPGHRTRRGSVSQALALAALLIALVPLLGYIFGVRQLYGISRFTGIALNTAIALALLATGTLLVRTDTGIMSVFAAEDSGGMMLRRLLPAAILLPILLGWLPVRGEALGWYDSEFGRTILVFSFIIIFSTLIILTAEAVSRHATARERAEAAERLLSDRLVETLESERHARAAAEHSSRMKDEFLATLSHELRTPLNAILGWANVLVRGTAGATDTRRGLEAIERNARLQAQLIEDLLDMNRIISGRLRLDVREVLLPPLIDSVLAAAAPAANAKSIRVERELDPMSGIVCGDPERLQQVIWNLVSNSLKFTPEGGRVDVRLRRVDSRVELEIADTGIGIRPEFLPQVFDRFRQADPSTTRRHGGLGLGLAIARHLTELHGGRLEAFSEGEGRGARFTVILPVASASPMEPEAADEPTWSGPAPESASLAGLRVLVVDDHADTRQLLERVLLDRGAEVLLADGVERALELFDRNSIDVLVSDIGMPDRDGYELIRHVRARPSPPPAIALTAFARPEDARRALEAGYRLHMTKPIRPPELIAAIARLAAGARRPA